MSSVDGPAKTLDPIRLVVSQMLRRGAKRACPSSSPGRSKVADEPSPSRGHPGNCAPRVQGRGDPEIRPGLEGLGRLLLPLLARNLSHGGGPAGSFQMPCSSSRSFRSRDHLSPLSSAVPLCRDSLSDLREDRDTWLM